MPSAAASCPYAATADDRDRIWVSETCVFPNRLVAFDAKKRVFEDQLVIGTEKTPNSIRHMMFDPKTRMLWFGQDAGFISGLKIPTVVVP
jgi:virginiamycin B lyase